MGVYEELKKTQTPVPVSKQPVVKAKHKFKKEYLMGCVSNGDSLIRLDDEYGVKVRAIDDNWVELILVDYGKEIKMEAQGYRKTKEVEKKLGNLTTNLKTEESEDLF